VIFTTEKQLVLLLKGLCHKVILPLILESCFSFGAVTVFTLLALWGYSFTKCSAACENPKEIGRVVPQLKIASRR